MKNIDSILHSELRPFVADNKGEYYYSPLFRSLKPIKENFTPYYSINFTAPELSPKVKYYKRLIDNSITVELNELFDKLQNNNNDTTLILYHRKKLFEKIESFLKETKKYIDRNHYDLSVILSPHADFSIDLQHKECTYIFNYLQTSLIRCYMEFQSHFLDIIEENKRLCIADFYTQILQKQAPENTFIKDITPIEISQDKTEAIKQKAEKEIVLSFVYSKLNTESSNITDLMNALKKNNSIAQDTSITDFKHAFSGAKVDNPIRWTSAKSELPYLIKLLCNTHKVLKYSGSIWKIVCACFVDKDGKTFSETNLKDQKKPILTANKIEKISELMK